MEKESINYVFIVFAGKHRDALEKMMAEIDLHAGQIFILNSLWNLDGQSQAEISKSLNVTAPTIYNMVVRMTDKGFVEVKKDPNDGRIMRVYLTKRGWEIKPQVEVQWHKLEELIFRNLTEPEKMMLTMLLKKAI